MTDRKKKRTMVRSALAVSAAALAALMFLPEREKDAAVELGYPVRRCISEVIPANGRIRPVTEVKISPDVSGEIVELYVREGDRVRKGDLLLKIRQDVYLSARDRMEASLNAARAQYRQQEASLKKAEMNFRRNERLFGQKAISDAEYETSQADYLVACEQLRACEFNILSAEASLKEAEENLVRTVIYAPMNGVVSRMAVEKGERVVGTSQMAGTEMMRIADLNRMEVVVAVNENDIVHIGRGDTASVSVDAYPGRKFTGVVTRIASSARSMDAVSDQVVTFEVNVTILARSYADLPGCGKMPFRPGMSASVSISALSRKDVLTVPLQAVAARKDLSGDEGLTGEYVFVVNDSLSRVRAVPVRTGIQDLRYIEITEGLEPSDHIVTGPYPAVSGTLKDGDRVISFGQ